MSSSRTRILLVSLIAVFAVSAVASASASAFLKEYQVCQKGGTEKFKEHHCTPGTKEAEGKWSWLPIAAGTKFPVTSTGGAFKLEGGGKSSDCTAVTNTGEIGPGGESTNVTLKFTGCSNGGKCEAFSTGKPGTKEIEVSGITDQLVEREPNGGGANKLADEFKENTGTGEFVTIEFKEGGVACPNYPPTKVKRQVAGECKNTTTAGGVGETELVFPNPELRGNTLEAFGGAASLFGTADVLISGTDAGWSVRCE